MIKSFKIFEDQSIKKQFIQACTKGDLETVKKLLNKGVDPSVNNNEPIQRAASHGHLDIVKTLLKDDRVDPSDESNFAILLAAANGHLDIVKLLLKDDRVDPSADDNYALKKASQYEHDKIVYLLLNHPKVYNKLSEEERKKYAKGRPIVIDMIKKINK